MRLENFQLLDNEPIDKSIIKSDYSKIYDQQGAQLNQSDQNFEFFFGGNNNYHQIGIGYLEIHIRVRKNDTTTFHNVDLIRLVNNGFSFCFEGARLCTTLGSDIEINKFCGQVWTIMRVISNTNGDLFSQFDNINENDTPVLGRLAGLPPQNKCTPHQKLLINNHTDLNKGKLKGCLYLEDIFGFCKSYKKVTKNLGFHLVLETADLQYVLYTSMTDDIIVTINNLYLFMRNSIPSVETQLMFNEATQNNYKISYDECFTERQVISDLLVQLDIRSTQQVKSPLIRRKIELTLLIRIGI